MELKQIEKISKALGDVTRLKILMHIAKHGGSMQCAKIFTSIDLAQPSVSHHIKTLAEAGLIEPEKEGRNYTYLLNKSLFKEYLVKITALAGK